MYRLFPLLGVTACGATPHVSPARAETVWSAPDVRAKQAFRTRLRTHLSRLDAAGVERFKNED
jgi:hypothetical protein